MNNLFAYGTLMCNDIMMEVSDFQLPNVPAALTGYRRQAVKGEQYPGLMPDKKGSVRGVVYMNVPDAAWKRLDRFEGEMYVRKVVQVEMDDGRYLPAETYIVRPNFLDQLEKSDWDFDNFLLNGRANFQKYYKGFRSFSENDKSGAKT